MRKLKAFLVLALVLMVSFCCTVSAGAYDMGEYASKLEVGELNSFNLFYSNGWTGYDFNSFFSFESGGEGTMNLYIKIDASPDILLYDENGKTVEIEEIKTITGDARKYEKGSFKLYGGGYAELTPSDAFGYYEGTITYKVKKGTYYIEYNEVGNKKLNSDYNIASLDMKVDAPQKKVTPKISYFNLSLPVGESIQAGAVLSGGSGTVTWKSTKPSIASVTSEGEITANKKGATTITAKCGTSTIKLKITVE